MANSADIPACLKCMWRKDWFAVHGSGCYQNIKWNELGHFKERLHGVISGWRHVRRHEARHAAHFDARALRDVVVALRHRVVHRRGPVAPGSLAWWTKTINYIGRWLSLLGAGALLKKRQDFILIKTEVRKEELFSLEIKKKSGTNF